MSGCFFHFGQSIWRKLQELGLQNEYGENEELSTQARSFAALAFVPLEVKKYLVVIESKHLYKTKMF